MPSTQSSRCEVFHEIAHSQYSEWPVYETTPFYDRSSLGGLEEDLRTVAARWFNHVAHESAAGFVCDYSLEYFEFESHDRYSGLTQYEMAQLFRVFLLKELHGWTHETALIEYLERCPVLTKRLGFDSLPDQSTLWRSWHKRFTVGLRETVETAARTILIKTQNAGVAVPREPNRKLQHQDNDTRSRSRRPDDLEAGRGDY